MLKNIPGTFKHISHSQLHGNYTETLLSNDKTSTGPKDRGTGPVLNLRNIIINMLCLVPTSKVIERKLWEFTGILYFDIFPDIFYGV